MLLSQLTANLQNQYATMQAQIEALQEQQRLIQAQLQRVGSVESKMESAAQLVAEAIAEIREVCPEELSAYQEVVSSLFRNAPVAQIEAGESVPDDAQTPENTVPPQSDEETAVEVDEAVDVEAVTVPEQVDEPQAPAGILHKQQIKPLRWLATKRNIDTDGMKRHQIASALVGMVSEAELREAIEQVANVG
jgi:hypothetical protein